jgi:hypothetical protein
MVDRLWVPSIQRLRTRSSKRAASGCALSTSSVPYTWAVSMPLRMGVVGAVVVMAASSPGRWQRLVNVR